MQTQRNPTQFLAERVRIQGPSPTLVVSDKARALKAQGHDVIDLGGGDPDFITPEHIRQAAIDAMNGGDTHYVASAGTPSFRQAIATKLQTENGITVDAGQGILVTPGAKAALFQAAMALVEPGVDVLVPEPAWVSYVPMIELAGGCAVRVPLDPDANFAITADLLNAAVTPGTRIIIINSPNNPTGRVLSVDELQAVADVANQHDLLVFADEMYEKIIYDGHRHVSIASLPGMAERTLTFNGLSKAFAMTGWRLGYVAGPPVLIQEIAKVHSHSVTCATSFSQAGGAAALSGSQAFIGEMVSAWDRRRHAVSNGLNEVRGMRCPLVEGAFYAFVDIRECGVSSLEMAERLLTEARVGVVPGEAFGVAGEGHIRLSFATGDELLCRAVDRIGDTIGRR
ncbi:MAG: pyridoxal phosphate-dependent aminotransferase [Chloroflexota bacterium]|nr:pyridoxal phosphate-dependent aminotransferase [Chloroflexota bacterium]